MPMDSGSCCRTASGWLAAQKGLAICDCVSKIGSAKLRAHLVSALPTVVLCIQAC